MEFRRLGRSGLNVSEISYGNWITHGSQVEEEQAHACVKAALDAGITTFDTADVYANTRAESVLGRALAGQRRESLEIFTKVFWPTGPGGPNDKGLGRKHIMESANASLERLQTEIWRVIEPQVVPASEEVGISQIVWSPIAQGVLTGKYLPGQPPPAGSRATDESGGNFISRLLSNDELLRKVQNLRPIAEEAGLSMAQLAVAWVLQNQNVASAIIGATRPEQVTENVKAAGVKLDAEVLKKIDEALDGVIIDDPSLGG